MKHTRHMLTGIFVAVGLMSAEAMESGFQVDRSNTALLVLDPQIDFQRRNGATWEMAGKNGALVFISPHYYYPWDHKWTFGGSSLSTAKP